MMLRVEADSEDAKPRALRFRRSTIVPGCSAQDKPCSRSEKAEIFSSLLCSTYSTTLPANGVEMHRMLFGRDEAFD